VANASRRSRRALVAAPAGPVGSFPPQQLQPGSSISADLSSGDVSLGAIGTVAYVDGDVVYAYGHPFEAAGRRSLLLQDAYVYGVVSNPLELEDLTSYKLAAPGHDIGTLTSDSTTGVAGRMGALPERTRLRVSARDLDTGRVRHSESDVADEASTGTPSGASPLSVAASLGVLQQATTILDAVPSRQSGEMCVRFELRESPEPLRFCNRYVVEGVDSGELVGPMAPLMAGDLDSAVALVTGAGFKDLHVTELDVAIRLRRGMAQAEIVRVSAPRRVRPGQRIRVTLLVRVLRGSLRTVSFPLRVPRLRPGRRELQVAGSSPDASLSDVTEIVIDVLSPSEDEESTEDEEEDVQIRSLGDLRVAFDELNRFDGVEAGFSRGDPVAAFRSPRLRIGGEGTLALRVVG
jgi:hypothetical protein